MKKIPPPLPKEKTRANHECMLSLPIGCMKFLFSKTVRPHFCFQDLRSVPEANMAREHVKNHRRACTQVLFLSKAEVGFFLLFRNSDRLAGNVRWSEDPSRAWLVPSTAEDLACWKQGFYRQVMELKIQMKNRGSALRPGLMARSVIWWHSLQSQPYLILGMPIPLRVLCLWQGGNKVQP
jgi:hypothetical protein